VEISEVEVKIRALIVDPNSGTPVVVLKDIEGDGMVPIWVGACEANAIASAIENTIPARPMTHDLLRNIIESLGLQVERIVITELKDNTYFSIIEMTGDDGQLHTLDARPSDAIALALRCASPIFVNLEVVNVSSEARTQESDSVGATGTEEWPDVLDDSGDLAM
jgi:hypothetical protein